MRGDQSKDAKEARDKEAQLQGGEAQFKHQRGATWVEEVRGGGIPTQFCFEKLSSYNQNPLSITSLFNSTDELAKWQLCMARWSRFTTHM
ncbi:hypothetical protein H6P81_018051 [Aristolochia fimbriata]|uniref:Uncharacterized protein n=1 Tax=Aristolochia fimbriata TaxID=158543 RepID=A0AAV7E470_ARIFI|nr:hypothetical protein H6P81_018051 [Aristolochia fimbriata]